MMQSHVDQNDGFCPKSYYWLTFRRFDTAAVALFNHTNNLTARCQKRWTALVPVQEVEMSR